MIALYLGRGAVSYYSDTQGALAAYTQVAELDPSHMAAHNWRGHLLHRLGDLPAAQNAYENVLSLADAQNDPDFKAAALGNLGVVAKTRGDLDAAEGFYNQALKLDKKLGRKEGMANQYSNLGSLEKARSNLKVARDHLITARDLYDAIGMPHMVEKTQGWLDDLGP